MRRSFLPAARHPLGGALVGLMIRHSLRRHFATVRLRWRGPSPDPARPLLVLISHVSWWDGYLAYLLEHWLGREAYLMMEERQLARYPFFRWVGCFSVDRQHPRRALASVAYAADLLTSAPHRTVFIFPQGQIVPNDRRPLVLESGAARLARRVGRLAVLPVALRYEHLGEQHPTAFIAAGPVWDVEPADARDPRTLTASFTERLTMAMDDLRAAVIAGATDDFRPLLTGRTSANVAYDRLLGRRS